MRTVLVHDQPPENSKQADEPSDSDQTAEPQQDPRARPDREHDTQRRLSFHRRCRGLPEYLLLRTAAICGLAAPASFVVGIVLADAVQPAAFSPVNDDISDLGALTASSPWYYNQVAANLTGILVLGFALGLWVALGRGFLSRLGVVGLVVVGTGMLLDGLFRLDCQGIDAGCDNTSWHSSAHKIESGVTAAALLLTPLVLAFALRRLPAWRRLWPLTLLATPAVIGMSAAFGTYGPGVASRIGSAVWFMWLAVVAFHLLRGASVATT